jgi:hypothetical protein
MGFLIPEQSRLMRLTGPQVYALQSDPGALLKAYCWGSPTRFPCCRARARQGCSRFLHDGERALAETRCALDASAIASPASWRDTAGAVIAAGLRPCSGEILAPVFALARGASGPG